MTWFSLNPYSFSTVRPMSTTPPAFYLLALTVSVFFAPFALGQACDPEGAWEVVSVTLTDSSGTVREVEIGDPPGLKVLSAGHWAFVEQTTDEASPTHGGGGRYTVEGNTYTEYVAYHTAASFVGTTIAFDCRTEGERWYQQGVLPDGTHLDEVYRRAE